MVLIIDYGWLLLAYGPQIKERCVLGPEYKVASIKVVLGAI